MARLARKDIVVSGGTGVVSFSVSDSDLNGLLSNANDQNIVLIKTTSTPVAGTFDCFVEYEPDTGFFGVTPIGGAGTAIDATKVGSGVANGDAEGWSFNGSPSTVKVTATGVTDGTYTVVVSQNHG